MTTGISVVTLPTTGLPPLADTSQWPAGAGPAPAGLLAELLAASAAVRRWAGWHITPVVTDTVTVNGHGGHGLNLPTMRLVELVEVVERRRGKGQVWTPVDLDPLTTGVEAAAAGYLYRDQCWPARLAGVRVTMRHGYEPDEVPELASLVAVMVARGLVNPTGVSSATVGGLSVQYSRSEAGYQVFGGSLDPFLRSC